MIAGRAGAAPRPDPVGGPDPADGRPGSLRSVGSIALALHTQSAGRRLARLLRTAGVPALLLKGPDLQQRLYGTPAEYLTSDVDVLVPERLARRARAALLQGGWELERGQEVLWWFSAASTYVREELRVDLHWGLHASHLLTGMLRPLERALWSRARIGQSGFLEPDTESLLVYLALHAAGHGYRRPEWHRNILACARQVRDWERVHAIARASRLERVLAMGLQDDPPSRVGSLLDGASGTALWAVAWAVRGHFVPRRARDRVRESLDLWRHGFRAGRPRTWKPVAFAGLALRVPPGVYEPSVFTEALVDRACGAIGPTQHPLVVDLGTGSGAVALAVASRSPSATVHATDVSSRAVACARRNAERLRVGNVRVYHGSLFDPLPGGLHGRVHVITANLPYVPAGRARMIEWGAPMSAIEGEDPDGLGLLREVASRSRDLLGPGGRLVFQIADWQWELFEDDLRALGFEPEPPSARRVGRANVASARWGGVRT